MRELPELREVCLVHRLDVVPVKAEEAQGVLQALKCGRRQDGELVVLQGAVKTGDSFA